MTPNMHNQARKNADAIACGLGTVFTDDAARAKAGELISLFNELAEGLDMRLLDCDLRPRTAMRAKNSRDRLSLMADFLLETFEEQA